MKVGRASKNTHRIKLATKTYSFLWILDWLHLTILFRHVMSRHVIFNIRWSSTLSMSKSHITTYNLNKHEYHVVLSFKSEPYTQNMFCQEKLSKKYMEQWWKNNITWHKCTRSLKRLVLCICQVGSASYLDRYYCVYHDKTVKLSVKEPPKDTENTKILWSFSKSDGIVLSSMKSGIRNVTES